VSHHPVPGAPVPSVDEVSIEEAYLGIPDEANEAILDAKQTYVITVVSTVIFVAAVFVFIL